MTDSSSLIAANNLPEKNENSDADGMEGIGNFVSGTDENFSANNIDKLNDTLVFEITNPSGGTLNVNLFGFTNALSIPPSSLNPPPTILNALFPGPSGPNQVQSAFCPINNSLYMAAVNVIVVDCATNTFTTTIPVPFGFVAGAIAYCPVNNQMYVGSSATMEVIRVDCFTNTIIGAPIATVVITPQISGITYNPLKNSMYVIGLGVASLNEIDCVTNLVTALIPIPGITPRKSVFNPTNNRLYITDSTTNNIEVLDCATNLPVISIPTVLVGAIGIDYSTVNNSVYATGQGSGNVVPVNCTTNIPGPAIPVGAGPLDIAYDTLNNLMFVVRNFAGSFYVVIDCVTNIASASTGIGAGVARDVVYNPIENSIWFTFETNQVRSLTPTSPPSAVIMISGGYTMGDLYNDLQGKPLYLKGMKMIAQSLDQFFNNIVVNYYSIYGKQDAVQFQPSNYISPTNAQSLIVDAADFEAAIDGNTELLFGIKPFSTLIMSFTINRSVDNTIPFKEDITKDWGACTYKTTNIRMIGNPVADMVLLQEAEKILSESGYNSQVQYAFYPRETGNPVADIALLNSAGFGHDH